MISIHTSAREVTDAAARTFAKCVISIHTSAREVTEDVQLYSNQYAISIHTSAREVTSRMMTNHHGSVISIHTSAREVTIFDQTKMAVGKHFNPHFRKGSDCNIPQKHLSIFMKYL